MRQYHFKQFVEDGYEKCEPTHANGGKLASNGFIGMLGRSNTKYTQHYVESNYHVVAHEFVNNEHKIEIKGVYQPPTAEAEHINLLNLSDDELACVINKSADKTSVKFQHTRTHYEYIEKSMIKQAWRCMNYICKLRISTQVAS